MQTLRPDYALAVAPASVLSRAMSGRFFPVHLFRLFAFVFLGFTGSLLHAAETATLTLANLERVYTASPASLSLEDVTISPDSETAGPYTLQVTYSGKSTPPTNAGRYTVKVTATSPTHTGTATGTLIIAPAPLTARATDAARVYGAANPKLTVIYEGLLGSDTEKVLNRKPSAKTTAKPSSPAGTYPIELTGGADNNYVFTSLEAGTLTVVPTFGGDYETLLFDLTAFDVAVGKLSLTLPAKGNSFTARFETTSETKPLAFSGKLSVTEDLAGVTGSALRNKTGSAAYQFIVTATHESVLVELLYRPDAISGFGGFITVPPVALIPRYTKAEPAPWQGAYTFVLPETTPLFDFNYPYGTPFATASIANTGRLTLTGKLPDGAPITASAYSDAAGVYRLFLRPYGTRLDSYLSGKLPLVPHPDTGRAGLYYVPASLENIFYWQKKGNSNDTLYPDGFSQLYTLAALDPWLPPAAAKKSTATPAITLAQRLGLAANEFVSGFANIEYGFADYGQSESDLPVAAEITPKNVFMPVFGGSSGNTLGWKITVSAKTGRFTATFKLKDTIETGPVTRSITAQGILRQPPEGDANIGLGYLQLPALKNAFDLSTLSHEFSITAAGD